MSTFSVTPSVHAVQSLPTTAEIIAHDLARLVDDEQALQHIVGLCLTLQRHGLLSPTQEAGTVTLPRVQRELALVRAAKRHLQHQARLEHLEICDLCGTAYDVTCIPCDQVRV